MDIPLKDCNRTRDIVIQGAFNIQILFVCIVSFGCMLFNSHATKYITCFRPSWLEFVCRHLVAPNKATLVKRAISCLRIH